MTMRRLFSTLGYALGSGAAAGSVAKVDSDYKKRQEIFAKKSPEEQKELTDAWLKSPQHNFLNLTNPYYVPPKTNSDVEEPDNRSAPRPK